MRATSLSESGKVALDYAISEGWHVFPLHNVAYGKCTCGKADCPRKTWGKHPRTPSGNRDATTAPDQIRAWWTRWPDANIGVATGADVGVVMIGPDGEQGIADLAELEQDLGPLPRTKKAKSGSGGQHLYFRWPSVGLPIKNRKNHRGTLIDVRGDGGHFVAPPSVNGNGPYQWIDQEAELAELPEAWAEWCRTDERKEHSQPPSGFSATASSGDRTPVIERARKYLAKMPEAIDGQRGHDRLFTAARVLVHGFRLPTEDAYDLLANEYNHRCLPPWSEKEIRHKIDQAATKPSKMPRGWLLDGDQFANGGWQHQHETGGQQRAESHKPPPAGGRFMPELLCAKDIPPEFVQWLWTGRVPLGRGTLVAGRGGLGKTLLLCNMAATVSRGRFWPDGHKSPRGDVLFLSAEDEPADTLVPRAMAAGAELTRIHFLRGAVAEVESEGGKQKKVRKSIDLKAGMDIIAEAVDRLPELKLVIIDPIGSYLGRGTDSHRDNEVREALDGIARLAAERGFAVVFIAHVNKSSMNAFADDAILGSRAFSTFCRATQHLVGDPDDKARRLLMPGKCNLAMTPAGLAYTVGQVEVDGAGDQPRVCWCPDPVEGDANDYVGTGGGRSGGRSGGGGGGDGGGGGELAEAVEFLIKLLNKPMLQEHVRQHAIAADISKATLKRAKARANVTSKPEPKKFEPGKPPKYWWGVGKDWQIPPPEEAQPTITPDLPLIP